MAKRIERTVNVEGEALSISLTSPSKMPGHSWSLQAGTTCPAAKQTIRDHGKAAICSNCYAKSGAYRFSNVQDAQGRRLQWLLHSLREDGGSDFVRTMVDMVRESVESNGEAIFRVHDSGDLFSEEYVKAWTMVALTLDEVQFWIPTREWIRDSQGEALRALAALPNVALRPSAVAINDPAPKVEGLSAGTTVAFREDVPEGTWICPTTDDSLAPEEKSCEAQGCRKCWDTEGAVAYLAHGRSAESKATRKAVKGKALPVVG